MIISFRMNISISCNKGFLIFLKNFCKKGLLYFILYFIFFIYICIVKYCIILFILINGIVVGMKRLYSCILSCKMINDDLFYF